MIYIITLFMSVLYTPCSNDVVFMTQAYWQCINLVFLLTTVNVVISLSGMKMSRPSEGKHSQKPSKPYDTSVTTLTASCGSSSKLLFYVTFLFGNNVHLSGIVIQKNSAVH